MRRVKFEIGEYYHIFNRGVDQREIFCDHDDYIRFIRGMREFNRVETIGSLYEKDYQDKKLSAIKRPGLQLETWSHDGSREEGFGEKKLVEIISYSLIFNHFHFILKPLVDNGVERFIHKICLGYASYYNNKYNRSGSLFQGPYKSIHIKTNENLLRLSSYVNGNSEIHKICKAENWQWGSYQDYLKIRNGTLCQKEILLKQFENIEEYREFTNYIIKESKDIKSELRNYILE